MPLLNPWIKKLNYQRSKFTGAKTITIPLTKTDIAYYPQATIEALSHFWLYPKIFCSFKAQLEKELLRASSKKDCAVEEKKIPEWRYKSYLGILKQDEFEDLEA